MSTDISKKQEDSFSLQSSMFRTHFRLLRTSLYPREIRQKASKIYATCPQHGQVLLYILAQLSNQWW